jgi:hypothetical protein
MSYDEEDIPAETRRGPRHATRVPDEVGEGIHQRLAAMQLRRLVDKHQHTCTAHTTGSCADPNHRRDMHLMSELLGAVGLSEGYPSYTEAEKRTWLKWIGQSGPAEADDLAA